MKLISSYRTSITTPRLKVRQRGDNKTPLEVLRRKEPASYDNNFIEQSNKDKFGQFGKIRTMDGWIATQKLLPIKQLASLAESTELNDDATVQEILTRMLLFKGWTHDKIVSRIEDRKEENKRLYDQVSNLLAHNPKKHLIPKLKEYKMLFKKKMQLPEVSILLNTTVRINGNDKCTIGKVTLVEVNGEVRIHHKSLEDLAIQLHGLINTITK